MIYEYHTTSFEGNKIDAVRVFNEQYSLGAWKIFQLDKIGFNVLMILERVKVP